MTVPSVTYAPAARADDPIIRLPRLSTAAIALIALFVLGLALRLAELDSIPLDEREAVQALVAWNLLHPQQAVAAPAPASPLLFALQTMLFSLFGASEFTARLPVVLAGAALPFTPLLLHDVLGRRRTFAFCLLLGASPLLLMASRQSHAVVLSLLLAVLILWALLRFSRTRGQGYASLVTLLLAILVLLGEAGGLLLALQLCLALLATQGLLGPEGKGRSALSTLSQWSRSWPFARALPPALLAVFLGATLFMLHPQGLANVGEVLSSFVAGFTSFQAGPASPFDLLQLRSLNLILLYEPLVVVTGLLWFWLRDRSRSGVVDRFLFIWLLAALASLFLWRGAGPAHTLWTIVPLAGLSSGMLADLFTPQKDAGAWPGPALPLAAGGSFCLAAMFSFYAYLLLRNPVAETTPLLALVLLPPVALVTLQAGRGSALLRGIVAGAAAFILMLSLGSGWTAVVVRADEADGLWRSTATSTQTRRLQDALQALANQESGGFAGLEVHAWKGEQVLLRWMLRDYSRLQFVENARDAVGADILLIPASEEALAGSGPWIVQEFVLQHRHFASPVSAPGVFYEVGEAFPGVRERLVLRVRQAEPEEGPSVDAAGEGAS